MIILSFQILKDLVGKLNVVLTSTLCHKIICYSDGCPESAFPVPEDDRIIITWPESDIANAVTVQCPCGSINESIYRATVSRECFGNYDQQAVWLDTDISAACSYTERLLDLCALSIVSFNFTFHVFTV